MSQEMNEKAKSSRTENRGRGNAYVAKFEGGNGERGVVVKEVPSERKLKTASLPPCLANHIVKPLT